MATTVSASRRLANANGLVSDGGIGAKLLLITGSKPQDGGALTAANQVLSTSTFPAELGVATSAGVALSVATLIQAPNSNISGTPTFVRVITAAGLFVMDVDIGAGVANWSLTSAVRSGVAVDYSAGLTVAVS